MGKREKHNSTSLVFPPSIFIGPVSAASSVQLLQTNSISHVLSIGASPSSKVPGVVYDRVSITDSPSSSIAKICDTACDIIETALQSNNGTGRILVHCSAGISRSPTVVTAYLIKHQNMSLRAALGQIVRARPQASPNPGFLRELRDLELQLRGASSLDIDELPKREKERLALFPVDDSGAAR
ncbi:protein-tyrosine phosphatase-like protein [Trichoderma sp. SZMC 28015]